MPGWELVNKREKDRVLEVFNLSNGVLFAHGFDKLRNKIFRVRLLEKKFSKKFNCNYSLLTTSGTMAQYVAMASMGIGPGDEVITQSFTFVSTVEVILALGATPIIVDIDEII